ncbi:sigma factor-like helix-turn-helix DNA-binding protein [Streptomyces boncukensis]|uniref:sigma factor-like helix-turn-helix DNA-binding protein n=1 Tax=Streptomyces boncukensis TaxID=2711219 RepID=UPI0019D11E0E|nr:sigma factor-like helix-turn-helix DNA-binding protein [Streptomyces boncukensis]
MQKKAATDAFDQLYLGHARPLAQQALLLSGHREIAERAVAHAFHRAWQRWPQVAVDSDPPGWLRAAVYDYALSPWHQLHPARNRPEAPTGPPADQELREALLSLPRSYRATLLLCDGLGLSLADAAAETEASTAAAGGRLVHARDRVAAHCAELRAVPPEQRGPLLARRLREVAAALPVRVAPPRLARRGSEHATRRTTLAALGLTAAVTAATAFTLVSAEPSRGPERDWTEPEITMSARSGSPSYSGSPSGTAPSGRALVSTPPRGHGPRVARPLPGPAEPRTRADRHGRRIQPGDRAWLPQLRSTNARMHLKNVEKQEKQEKREGQEK